MARLFGDENFPYPVVQELRRLGHDVLTIQEAGSAGQAIADEAVLTLASAQGRALLTLNRKHFVHLHARRPDHAGILACSFDLDFRGQAERIHAVLDADLGGRLIRINRPPR